MITISKTYNRLPTNTQTGLQSDKILKWNAMKSHKHKRKSSSFSEIPLDHSALKKSQQLINVREESKKMFNLPMNKVQKSLKNVEVKKIKVKNKSNYLKI